MVDSLYFNDYWLKDSNVQIKKYNRVEPWLSGLNADSDGEKSG